MSCSDRVPLVSATIATCAAVGVAAVLLRRCRHNAASEQESGQVCADSEVLAGINAVREEYDLSESGGFLPSCCLERLPPAFDEWEVIAQNLSKLNRSGGLRQAIDRMPELDAATLLADAAPEVLRRAYLVLGMFAHSYVHGGAVPWQLLNDSGADPEASQGTAIDGDHRVVPPQLARPWVEVCSQLRMPPVLTAGATDLWNWHLQNPELCHTYGNLNIITSLTGTATETNFHMVPCAMQAAAAQVVPKVFLADILVRGRCNLQLANLLRELTNVLREFKVIFSCVATGVDRDTFYDVYRPLLDGFSPDGVILSGINAVYAAKVAPALGVEAVEAADVARSIGPGCAVRVRSKGPSAGQSTMIILFDLFLGVEHGALGSGFQEEMLMYMPEPHRRMIKDYREKWQDTPSVRQFVLSQNKLQGGAALAEAYDLSVGALRELRRFHLTTVSRYLTRTDTGTGSSTWRRLLQTTLEGTEAACLAKVGSAVCPR